jgi:hypothetical protein
VGARTHIICAPLRGATVNSSRRACLSCNKRTPSEFLVPPTCERLPKDFTYIQAEPWAQPEAIR